MKLKRYKTVVLFGCVIFLLPGCPDPGLPDIIDITDPEATTDTGDEVALGEEPSVEDGNNAPRLSAWAVSGTLIAGRESVLVLQCQIVDPDGDAVTVEADLSEVGGSSSQEMSQLAGDTYMWDGTVTPTGSGGKTITVRATDSKGASDEVLFLHTVESE
ncbi:MAG: hypothetical protein ACYTF1_06255 [Planctomycetota bacterium]|jgi:hypothetical protein